MAIAGYTTVLRRTGTPTAMTTQDMSPTAVTNQYQIDSTARRIWNRFATFNFDNNGGSSISSTQVSDIDYLFGKVTFKSTQGAVPKVTGQYLPTAVVAGAYSYSLSMGGDLLDDTAYENASPTLSTAPNFRSRIVGLRDVSLTVSRWDDIDKRFYNQLIKTAGSTIVVVEITPGGTTGYAGRGFFVAESEDRSGDVGALEQADVSLMLDGDDKAAWGWENL